MRIVDLIRKIVYGKQAEIPESTVCETVEPAEPVEPVCTEAPAPEKPSYAFLQELLAVTCIGYSHIKDGTVCQDSSLSCQTRNYRLIAVSDGHGSASFPRSDRGSRLACLATKEACASFAEKQIPQDREQAAKELCEEILDRWMKAVYEDHAADPFDEASLEKVPEKYRDHYRTGSRIEHAYGATLIAVLETSAGVLAIRCGDGECVKIDASGAISRPIPWNEKCDVNVTTSLCDQNAIEEFRWMWLDDTPAAIWISTDGLDNSYPVPEELDEFYANLSLAALDANCDLVRQELEKFLPILTQRCSQDDISVAAMMNKTQLIFAQDRLRASVELRRALREKEGIQRRIKKLDQALRDKKRKDQDGKTSWEDTEQMQQSRELTAQLEALEDKILRLQIAAGAFIQK